MYEERQAEPAVFTVKIQPNSSLCGIHLTAIAMPEQCALLGLLRDGLIISIKENPAIYAGDFVLAIALHPMMVPALKVTLKRTHPVYYSLRDCLIESKPEIVYTSNGFHSNEMNPS
jgi:NhaP-type Na+/H+ and K+/H+ antiporter